MNETTKPMARTIQRWPFITTWAVASPAAAALAAVQFFQQVVSGSGEHGRDREQEAELERGGPAQPAPSGPMQWSTWNAKRRERWPRATGKADPDRLAEAHLFDVIGRRLVAAGPRVDYPHHDAADQHAQWQSRSGCSDFCRSTSSGAAPESRCRRRRRGSSRSDGSSRSRSPLSPCGNECMNPTMRSR